MEATRRRSRSGFVPPLKKNNGDKESPSVTSSQLSCSETSLPVGEISFFSCKPLLSQNNETTIIEDVCIEDWRNTDRIRSKANDSLADVITDESNTGSNLTAINEV